MSMAHRTEHEIFSQVRYYRQLRFTRARILYEMKRTLGKSWNANKIKVIDAAIKGIAPRKTSVDIKKISQKIARFVPLRKRGKLLTGSLTATSLQDLEKKAKRARTILEASGFKFKVVRGDVGDWTWGFVYTKQRNTQVFASISLKEKSRPKKIVIEIGID